MGIYHEANLWRKIKKRHSDVVLRACFTVIVLSVVGRDLKFRGLSRLVLKAK